MAPEQKPVAAKVKQPIFRVSFQEWRQHFSECDRLTRS